jgi:hypothetical protein
MLGLDEVTLHIPVVHDQLVRGSQIRDVTHQDRLKIQYIVLCLHF